MATKPFHYFIKQNTESQFWPTDSNSSTTIDAESFVYYDTGAGFVLPLSNDVNGANFVGQTQDQNPASPYSSNTSQWQMGGGNQPPNYPDNHLNISRSGQTFAKATGSENYSPGTTVGIGADAQTISTAASNKWGYVSGDQTPVTNATAGQLIKIDFRAAYPNVKSS